MTQEEIEDIRRRYAQYGDTEKLHNNTAVKHIRLLLAELDRRGRS